MTPFSMLRPASFPPGRLLFCHAVCSHLLSTVYSMIRPCLKDSPSFVSPPPSLLLRLSSSPVSPPTLSFSPPVLRRRCAALRRRQLLVQMAGALHNVRGRDPTTSRAQMYLCRCASRGWQEPRLIFVSQRARLSHQQAMPLQISAELR